MTEIKSISVIKIVIQFKSNDIYVETVRENYCLKCLNIAESKKKVQNG